MVANFDNGTLYMWNNAQLFVCNLGVQMFASAIEQVHLVPKICSFCTPSCPGVSCLVHVTGIVLGVVQKFGWKF